MLELKYDRGPGRCGEMEPGCGHLGGLREGGQVEVQQPWFSSSFLPWFNSGAILPAPGPLGFLMSCPPPYSASGLLLLVPCHNQHLHQPFSCSVWFCDSQQCFESIRIFSRLVLPTCNPHSYSSFCFISTISFAPFYSPYLPFKIQP